MRLLDLFCGAGGAAMGYSRAGFDEIVGVDIRPMPRFPFTFVQGDALDYLREHGHEFDAIHASPPCQAHTTMSNRYRGDGGVADAHVDLIGATRSGLLRTGKHYVIENVPGARGALRPTVTLAGGALGLGVDRQRMFECSFWVPQPIAQVVLEPVGVYGARPDGRRLWTRKDGSQQRAARSIEEGGAAMGIDWMEWRELAEAIPPAYTEYIGRHLLEACRDYAQ